MTESELQAHALGMKAFLSGKPRSKNPWDFFGGMDELDLKLCQAWFRGWDDAKRAS